MTVEVGGDHGRRCAPLGVHDAFVDAIMAYDDEEMRLLAGMLFRCPSALPDEFRRWLCVSAGATYGEAAERIWQAAALRARGL